VSDDDTLNAAMRHARALWRAEMTMVEIRLGVFAKRTGLFAFAGLIGAFGLGFLNVAAYMALAPGWGDAAAMTIVAVADLVLAGIVLFIATRHARDAELALAEELRDQAVEALELDARIAIDDVTGFVRRPVQVAGSASAALIAIITAILRARRR
jgi:hypothetical protein